MQHISIFILNITFHCMKQVVASLLHFVIPPVSRTCCTTCDASVKCGTVFSITAYAKAFNALEMIVPDIVSISY